MQQCISKILILDASESLTVTIMGCNWIKLSSRVRKHAVLFGGRSMFPNSFITTLELPCLPFNGLQVYSFTELHSTGKLLTDPSPSCWFSLQ